MLNFKIIFTIILLILSSAAFAQLPLTRAGKGTTGGGGGSCSNSLDFSDGCNSQYVPII